MQGCLVVQLTLPSVPPSHPHAACTGADPMADLLKLAEVMRFSKKFEKVSLGQGQGPKAEKVIAEGMEKGLWVCLQNCHLAVSWMPTLERIVDSITPEKVRRDAMKTSCTSGLFKKQETKQQIECHMSISSFKFLQPIQHCPLNPATASSQTSCFPVHPHPHGHSLNLLNVSHRRTHPHVHFANHRHPHPCAQVLVIIIHTLMATLLIIVTHTLAPSSLALL
jgi:Dynein heavy chain region D6 P-loop domain